MRYDRCKKLFGKFEHLQKLNVLICGVGGVGGYALDCLYRSGVKNITIVDFDTFDITNQNRQIGSEFLGEKKVEVLARLYPGVTPIDMKLTPQNIENLNLEKYDIVIDAIDDLNAKIALILKAYPKIVSSMGAAKRIDPTKIRIDSIWKTQNDPFAKKIRDRLKKENFKGDFKAVFSLEKPIPCDMGSFVGVTGAFGFALCSEVLKDFV
ncbi:tRNA threonylcarbamoyladenosine dehydratase [Caminibacter pacificus]|uniref:tRNA A37 threonylcarbamoyladenosine dehydratase n=1 Tax=Caminibacter pacificus TaxID=1424653 RepID=A0AAJ4UYF7_9BACT|nr:tRNA threonylcarbamoyladenosine dehydratase [Caminibacter pacificus]QCI28453.1 tRNA threonylcarbamoyladenosine dehydratase [Caminibacter pacificus]ROR40822.1 tRNA A37 threonylcarbamoyladenosine dehydratase [Caminibacter pacificus]